MRKKIPGWTVAELTAELANLPPDLPVVILDEWGESIVSVLKIRHSDEYTPCLEPGVTYVSVEAHGSRKPAKIEILEQQCAYCGYKTVEERHRHCPNCPWSPMLKIISQKEVTA